VRHTFALLGAHSREEAPPRKPPAKVVFRSVLPLPEPSSGLSLG
jgi:hypothetical protein